VDYYKWTQWIFLQLFDSYFDPAAKKAKPIADLHAALENDQYYISAIGELVSQHQGMEGIGGVPAGCVQWAELDQTQRRDFIDNQRLAYLATVPVNWCPALGTVLANEEVTNDGRSERGNHPVYRRPLRQWMLRITAYADRLAADLDKVDWPESVRQMQRNWVGRSEGAMVDFNVADGDQVISVFTTRPDTLFGATYMVLAPEHDLVDAVTTEPQRDAVRQYQQQAAARTDVDRMVEAKTKTGVFTGGYAINPVNNERIPIWIADYVLTGYGTGAIMAVPAHDERDFAFARQFDLPIVEVISEPGRVGPESGSTRAGSPVAAFTGDGVNINSANDELSINGLPTPDAKAKIVAWLESKGIGQAKVQYKLRDWLFSRQRYWGEPFPILHGPDGEIRAVDEADLPVEHPHMDDFKPHASDDPDAPPRPPLGRAPGSWREVIIDGVKYERELNTMPQWAGSCWYYLRFCDPRNSSAFADRDIERYWMNRPKGAIRDPKSEIRSAEMGVDLYVGGVEHAVLHLLYARFWHKVLDDLGHVSTPEPFGRLFNQGYIQAYCYRDARGIAVPAAEVVNADGKPAADVQGEKNQRFFHDGEPVTEEYGKMGKSLKNAVSPDEVCDQYGCDTLRLYEMYMGPLDQSKPWATRDIVGVHRFCQRIWRNFIDEQPGRTTVVDDEPGDDELRTLHKTIARVTADMEAMSFNTAIAKLIELNNALVPRARVPRAVAEPMLRMLTPLAPHLAEELWQRIGGEGELFDADWPEADSRYLVEKTIELPVQVLGKLRGRITVPADADNQTIESLAKADENVALHLEGKIIRKVIIVPGKMVNIVAT
jgi:leucyl-tRNA synthetase